MIVAVDEPLRLWFSSWFSPPAPRTLNLERKSMFSNSSNVIINGGSYFNVQGSGLNGSEIWQRHVSPDALHNSLEQSNSPKCHPNTRTAVLKDILSWTEDDTSETQVLWLHGPAGAGKTAIGHSVVEMSQERKQFAAGFFFSRTAAGRNHEKCLIATIAYQLLQSIPEVRTFIEAVATKDPLIFTQSSSSQIRHLIVDPLKQMLARPHNPFPRLIVIDGLDECSPQESQTNVLTAIHTAFKQDSFPFRVLICSRAEPNIRDMFESELADSTHQISLDDKYEPDIDIALYLRSKFSEIVRKHRRNRGIRSLPLPWPSEKTIQTLVSKASGQFIYAATVIRYVDVRHERPDDRLKTVLGLSGSQSSNPFTELDELYQEIFRTVVDIPLTSRLLGALLLLKTPLPVASLENLLRLQPGDAELALCHLHSVVRMPDDIASDDHASDDHIGLYHASLGDFLFDSQRAGVYHIRTESAHATLAESCLRNISTSTLIYNDMGCQWLARDPAAEYAWHNWIHHFLNVFCWNDQVIQEFRKLPPGVLLAWLTRHRRSIDEPLRDLRGTVDQFNKLKSWFITKDTDHKLDGLTLGTLCGNTLELYFKNVWADILGDSPQNVALSLGILAVALGPSSISSAALATLFKLDWVGFARATVLIRPYINFGTSVDVACDAFSDFISHPEHVSEFNPNTPDIHADLVIRCVECISSHPFQNKQIWQLDPEGAYLYSLANWKDHLRQASSRRLLDYAYAVTTRLGHRCTHEDPCENLCDANRIVRCIESNIIVAFPCITSISDINLLLLLKEIIAAKSLHRDPCFPEIPPSLTANTSLIVHGDYQYASSQYLRHVNSNGRPLGFSSTMRCTCLSEISSVPDISNFTSDDHASLVIRVIQCITARHHSKAGQCEREQADFDSAGVYRHALLRWKEHLHNANPRRLLNYTYVVNVRSGHQPICPDENKCDLLCDVNGITRCIESRIIDGEFFPDTLSAADTILLKLLREIIDVKYLRTPQFAGVNSRIQVWSTAYRLAIAKTQGK